MVILRGDIKNMKKIVVGLLLGCMVVCSACGLTESEDKEVVEAKEHEEHTETVENTETVVSEEKVSEKIDYSVYTKDYPVEKRGADYYWNIDTSGFDKSMFDGVFSVFGYDFNGKITGSTLQANGFGIETGSFTKSLYWDEEKNCFWDLSNGSDICRDGVEIGEVTLMNYNNEEDFYSDSTEAEFYCCDSYCTFGEAIIPKCLVTDQESQMLDALTLDDIIANLGVPTYVEGRRNSSIDDLEFFEYIYVYDEYVLKFASVYNEKKGVTVTGFTYDGRTIYDQPCSYYNFELDEKFNSPFEFLERDQAVYLESIK